MIAYLWLTEISKEQISELHLTNCQIYGSRTDEIIISIDGVFKANDIAVINSGIGRCINIDNGANSTYPNALIDVSHNSGIFTGSSMVIIDGINGQIPISSISGNLNHIYRGGNQLKNESLLIKDESGGTLIGLTITDSIDRVAQVITFDETLGKFIVNPCVDNIN